MDRVFLKGLRFRGFHGYYDHERSEGNDFEIDLVFFLSLEESAAEDDLTKTADYQQAIEIAASVINGESVKLIETLAFRIGQQLTVVFPNVQAFEVTVRKLTPPVKFEVDYSEVTMKWPR